MGLEAAGSDTHDFTLYFDDTGGNGLPITPPYTLTVNDTDLADGAAF